MTLLLWFTLQLASSEVEGWPLSSQVFWLKGASKGKTNLCRVVLKSLAAAVASC